MIRFKLVFSAPHDYTDAGNPGGLYHSKYHEYFYLKQPEYKQRKRSVMSFVNNYLDYAALGLSDNCTDKELKSAYRRLSRRSHPDTGGTHEQFIQISNAYNAIRAVRGL